MQTRTATDYRLILTFPEGCASPSACSIFVGIDTNAGNNAYLDVYLEATAQAWVAVGFSTTRSMVSPIHMDACVCILIHISRVYAEGIYNQG